MTQDVTPSPTLLQEPAAGDGRAILQVDIEPVPLGLLARALAPDRVEHLRAVAERAKPLLSGRVVWNVNSTAQGGGVAEMLQALLAYARGAVDTRWLVLRATTTSSRSPSACTTCCTALPATAASWARPSTTHYERAAGRPTWR